MKKRNGIYILSIKVALLGALVWSISHIGTKLEGSDSDALDNPVHAQTVSLRFTIADAGSGNMLNPYESGIRVRLIEGRKASGSRTIASDQSIFAPFTERPWEVSAKVDGPLTVSIEAQGFETEHILLNPTTGTNPTEVESVRAILLNRTP